MKILYIILISFLFISCGKNNEKINSDVTEKKSENNSSGKTVNEGQNTSTNSTDEFKILEFNKNDIPKDAKFKGNLVAGARWLDKNGDNFVIISETDVKNYSVDGNDVVSKEINAYCYTTLNNQTKLVWDIIDFIKDCPLDMRVELIPNSLTVTDINKNGIGESTFLYALSCKGDVSPDDLKLMMHEGNIKYALRGETKVEYEVDGKSYSDGGKYTADSSFNSAPDGFLDYAKQQWNKFYLQKF